jgi:[acyl-carrier-protein] S-malonyltransferase
MGKDLYQADARVRDLYDWSEAFLDFPLKRLSFEGPLEELTQTRITQPAIFVMSCAVDFLLKERGVVPVAAAGHSLGEFSALVSAGVLTFEAGLKLVKLRGELMQKAGEIRPGAMSAIIGLDSAVVEEVCRETAGIVVPANYNSPGQLVISGEVSAVESAMNSCKERGAKIVKRLTVSGAFHSPLMEFASEALYEALNQTYFAPGKFPVYCNVSARPAPSAEEYRNMLKKQLLSPVKWENSIRNMIPLVNAFVEVGPGEVLTGLLKRTGKNLKSANINKLPRLDEFLKENQIG